MILVDSCVWSLALRRKISAQLDLNQQQALTSLTQAIRNHQAAIVGPIRQEVLSGIQDSQQFQRIKTSLSAYPDELILTADYEEAARLANLCRSQGPQSGPVDILLCAITRRRGWNLLTIDTGLIACMRLIAVTHP